MKGEEVQCGEDVHGWVEKTCKKWSDLGAPPMSFKTLMGKVRFLSCFQLLVWDVLMSEGFFEEITELLGRLPKKNKHTVPPVARWTLLRLLSLLGASLAFTPLSESKSRLDPPNSPLKTPKKTQNPQNPKTPTPIASIARDLPKEPLRIACRSGPDRRKWGSHGSPEPTGGAGKCRPAMLGYTLKLS